MFQLLNGLLFLLLQDPSAAVDAAKPVETPAVAPAEAAATDGAAATKDAEQPSQETEKSIVDDARARSDAAFDAATDVAGASTSTDTVKEAELPPMEPGKAGVAWLILLLVVFVPIVLANMLASMWRVKEWTSRLWVVMFTLMLGAAPFLTSLLRGDNIGDRFRLGIDLAGGTNMVFQIKPEKELTNDLIDEMVKSVRRRVNPSGTEEITVRGVGGGRIEVIIPGADPQTVDEIKKQITRLGSLEFFIAADRAEDREMVRAAEELDKATKDLMIDGVRRAIWTPADEKKGEPQLLRAGTVVSRKVEQIRRVNGKPERYEKE